MIDFHTHILPDIDDGAENVEDSVKMIQMLCEQGVKKILLTPHFYAYVSSVESFLEKRKRSLEKLLKALETEKPDVDIYIGGEVLFFEELWRISDLKSLCISGTEYILLEMPFSSWDRGMVENVIIVFEPMLTSPIIRTLRSCSTRKSSATRMRSQLSAVHPRCSRALCSSMVNTLLIIFCSMLSNLAMCIPHA